MINYLYVAQIITAIILMMAVLLQVKGGGLGGIFGQPDSVYRTRRGVEKTFFRVTIATVVLFVFISILSVRIGL